MRELSRKIKSRHGRWVVIALVAGVAIGAVTMSPAIGGGLFTKKKAKRLFYTKQQSDSRYLTPGSGDARYLPRSGNIRLQVSPDQWIAGPFGGATVDHFASYANLISNGAANFNAGVTLPSLFQGRPVQLDSFELCYRVNTNALITGVLLAKTTPTSADITPSQSFPISDGNLRHAGEEACRTYSGAGPVAIGPQDMFQITLESSNSGSASIQVSRLTVNLSD
jgi:hypothetical protein